MLLLPLLGCSGAKPDTGDPPVRDTADDTGDTGASPAESLAGSTTTFIGGPSSATGSAVTGADLDEDGRPELVVSAFYAGQACVWSPPPSPGAYTMDSGACLLGEALYDFAGYAVAATPGVGLLVSAIGNDESGIEAGKVYLLREAPSGDTPLAEAPVSWYGQAPGDYAGTAVAAAGDVDGDGEPDVLVGASGCDAGGAGGGRAYLLRGPFLDGTGDLGAAWATFTGATDLAAVGIAPPHGASTGGDALGEAVAGLGDIDGDGLADFILGASGSDASGSDAGAAWIVRGPAAGGDHLAAHADLLLHGPGPGAYLGGAVAGPGDLDGDGLADVLVAADGWEGGAVYVLLGPGEDGTRTLGGGEDPVLLGATPGDLAGWSMAGVGDTDGDGQPEVVIGAPGVDRIGVDGGAVYRVANPSRPGVTALADTELWLGEAAGDAAGRAVAGVGDADLDGRADWLVGAVYNQDGGVYAGKAYLVTGAP